MEVLDGTVLPRFRFGWYYRPATHVYEFWWMGEVPMISVSAEMLATMPKTLFDEIMIGAALKQPLD